ncbi:IspD/TarI family cytidylyltransferase [Candidatus Neoehrlichia procyonis]|uniref:2-C-methyl-D-erythritol 4-phosphate cytidylyltransferase n=1 Tax=Candidatus Neoehrlichia procyonis str. RAC413 TaxID=1359163 RepID=A0A0F3NQU7_9RICK|nr:IspD/TarI family cytidylyltransferase [Candidatus Neoehrlichia lotoris]KJV69279.1 hypothetical protein NLO413_0663 [Candidatus Neoehrlichia lotoris str. RAC413]
MPYNSPHRVKQMAAVAIIIVAAGTGNRCHAALPKQYNLLDNYSVLYHTINNVLNHPNIDYIQVVIKKEHENLYNSVVSDIVSKKLLLPVYGGNRRQDSARLGLQSIAHIKPDFVLIHDACRPFITHDLLGNLIKMLDQYIGAVPTLSINETIKTVHNNIITSNSNIDRDSTKIIQTPQAYKYQNILTCHELAYRIDPYQDFTDDTSILLEYNTTNVTVTTVDGYYHNIKITTSEDLYKARMYIQNNILL